LGSVAVAPVTFPVQIADIDAIDLDGPAVIDQAGKGLEYHRFPGAVLTHEDEGRALGDKEVDPVHDRPAVKGDAKFLHADHITGTGFCNNPSTLRGY